MISCKQALDRVWEEEQGRAGRFPAMWLAGGKGPGVEKLGKVRAHLWVVLGRREVLEGGGSMG